MSWLRCAREARTSQTATEALHGSIIEDESRHGGLLSRDTIRITDKVRLLVAAERRRRGEPQPPNPDGPRQPKGPLT
jgi:hypothetical protein